MTSVNEMNAILQERARIREAVVRLTKHHYFDEETGEEVNMLVGLGEVLAILTENILKVPQEEKK